MQDLERLAASVLSDVALRAPIDSIELAALCGLSFAAWPTAPCRGALAGNVILYRPDLAGRALQAVVAHELAHWLLRDEGLADTEARAVWLSHALLLPAEPFASDIGRTFSVAALQRRHPNAPASWIARRVTQLRSSEATATIMDDGVIVERIASAWLPELAQRGPTALERRLLRRATSTGVPARLRGAVAVPVPSPRVMRVVLVAPSAEIAA